ncbi:MAG: sensor domain-containing diguanylate cyclase [Clostridiales bacterium]|nr:sensor domain-containing diguanylate cyclase [Clostridiales bacterium]
MSESILWEQDLATGVCTFFGNYEKIGNYFPTDHFPEGFIQAGYVYPDDVAVVRRLFVKARDKGIGGRAEIRLLHTDRQYLWFQCQVQPMLDNNGSPHHLIGSIVNIDRQKRQTHILIKKAQTDPLTGLLNRQALCEHIQTYLDEEDITPSCTLLLLDIDHFKKINDTFGHLAGDQSLTSLSYQLKELAGKNALIGRIGGDEFIVFFKGKLSPKEALQYAVELREGCCSSFTVNEKPYSTTVSIGIAQCQQHGYTFEDLYQQADQAMYEAKNAGRNLCRIYHPDRR